MLQTLSVRTHSTSSTHAADSECEDPPLPLPDQVNDQEEYEVEDLLSHRKQGAKTKGCRAGCPGAPSSELQDLGEERRSKALDIEPD